VRKVGAILLLDGLDEAPNRAERETLTRMFEKTVADNEKCRFVVTTRPRAYEGLALLSGFDEVEVQPFGPEAVETFLRHWSRGLYPEDPAPPTSITANSSPRSRANRRSA